MQHTQTAAPSGSQQHCQHASCEKQAWPQQHRLNVWVGHTSILPHMYSGACVGRILYCAANSCRSIAEQSYQQQVPNRSQFHHSRLHLVHRQACQQGTDAVSVGGATAVCQAQLCWLQSQASQPGSITPAHMMHTAADHKHNLLATSK